MFLTPGDVIRTLKRLRDPYDPRSSSLMLVGGASEDPHAEPFHRGFIDHFEERAELQRRLEALDERDRALLLLWYCEGRPVAHIARTIGISRVHCYRLGRRAIQALLDRPDGAEQTAASPALQTA